MNLFKKSNILIIISAFSFPINGCKSDKCAAGADGSIVIKASIAHHDQGIKGATLHIKYCDQELPGTSPSDYDLNIKGNDADTFVVFKGLHAGDYFFYGTGFDSTIVSNVQGGQPFTLSETNDTVRWTVFVTE